MSFEDFPDPNEPVHELEARDRWHAISELMDIVVATGKVNRQHRAAVEKAVIRRETSLSTSIGSGIAIPHAMTNLIKEPIVAFGRSRAGINFDAHDKKPVYKVCLFLLPTGQFQKHLTFLANIAKLLSKKGF
jgi:mannitol/fructose-specific phosphotransferase system IIA component (Ntr-type)